MRLDQGREIFAVPGSPLDPRARGANRLIQEGATLTESAEDILAVLSPMLGGGFGEPDGAARPRPADAPGSGSRPHPRRSRGSAGPRPGGDRRTDPPAGAPAAAVLTVILELELAGRCRPPPGNRVGLGLTRPPDGPD